MDGLALVASLSVMATVFTVILSMYATNGSNSFAQKRLEGILTGTSVVDTGGSNPPLRRSAAKLQGMFSEFMSGKWAQDLMLELERADSNMKPSEFVLMRLALAGFAFVIPLVLLGPTGVGILASMVALFIGFMLPRFYLNTRRKNRVKKLDGQLPETLTLVSNSLKAGFGLLQGLDLAAKELPHPISTELARAIHEMNVGSSVEESLLALNERCGSNDLDLVVTAIQVQRTVGGNLSEILETVAETMRERSRIRGEINTLTAQQKATGLVIALLPVSVAALFMVISPDYIGLLFTTTMGKVMLCVTAVMEVIGVLIIQRILAIEV